MTLCDTSFGKASKNTNGYARIYDPEKKKSVKAHRYIWEKYNGPIPKGFVVMHKCDNRACTNIEHLKLGTQGDNIKDMYLKGRQGNKDFPIREDHHLTTLTEPQVNIIRGSKYWRGMYTYFAKEFNTTRQTISNIYRNKTWKSK